MSTHIPEMTAARGARPEFAYTGNALATDSPGGTLKVGPVPAAFANPAIRDGQRKKPTGLLPARAGSQHALVLTEAPKVRVDPKDVSKTRAELRRAKHSAAAKEAAMIATAAPMGGTVSDEYKAALLGARDANDLVVALTRKLADLEASSVGRPTRVVIATVREPGEVSDVIDRAVYVCLHEGCRGDRWDDEAVMRRAHPTAIEMERKQACHVFALLCDAPLDPLDPEGEVIGYVAPIGSDGRPVTMVAEEASVEEERDAEMDNLRATVAALTARLDAVDAAKGKK